MKRLLQLVLRIVYWALSTIEEWCEERCLDIEPYLWDDEED